MADQLLQYTCSYADQDPDAQAAIAKPVADAGRQGKLISYTDFVKGIDVCISTINGGQPFRLGAPEWTVLHSVIIGDFLGRLCVDTYLEGGFKGSALVVAADTMQPSQGYRDFMRQCRVLTGTSEQDFVTH